MTDNELESDDSECWYNGSDPCRWTPTMTCPPWMMRMMTGRPGTEAEAPKEVTEAEAKHMASLRLRGCYSDGQSAWMTPSWRHHGILSQEDPPSWSRCRCQSPTRLWHS